MSPQRETASDTGPLITLEKLDDGYCFIRLLYDRIVIPRAVLRISGIAGQVVKAFRAGLISGKEAQDKLRELLDAGRINRKIHTALAAVLGEG